MDVASARNIPQVDRVLREPRIEAECRSIRRELVAEIVRREIESVRASALDGGTIVGTDEIVSRVVKTVERLRKPALRKVINGTGVILNTNLGRAPLPVGTLEAIAQVSSGYANLEFDLRSGKRGERGEKIEELLCLLTGCEAAIVVNNNAAAVLLAVATIAKRKEVIVSRGELIEIGGSFRVPDVIAAAGGILREVGTTNRTRAEDYKSAIGDKTAMILRCHRSNFEITGFTQAADLQELLAIAADTELPVVDDLGSGVLFDLSSIGLKEETTVQSVVSAGCDVVTFSGDKLLGGPQAGIIVGKKKWIQRLRKNALYRALRADKLVLSALEYVLSIYLRPDAVDAIPVLSMAAESVTVLRERVSNFAERAKESLQRIDCQMVATKSAAGGGSLPGQTLDSYGLQIRTSLTANRMASVFRQSNPPVIGIVQDDHLILDFRTIAKDDEPILLGVLQSIDSSQVKGL
jgi:L-seryl-tRNA(Ser) seleniumtransferase